MVIYKYIKIDKIGTEIIEKSIYLEGPVNNVCLFRPIGPKSPNKTGLTTVIHIGSYFDVEVHPKIENINKNVEKILKTKDDPLRALHLVVGDALGNLFLFRYI